MMKAPPVSRRNPAVPTTHCNGGCHGDYGLLQSIGKLDLWCQTERTHFSDPKIELAYNTIKKQQEENEAQKTFCDLLI